MKKILIKKLIGLNRFTKQMVMIAVDSCLIIVILLVSFSIRLDYLFWPSGEIYLVVMGAPILAIPIFIIFKLYNSVVRYIGSSALWSVVQAASMYGVVWGLFTYFYSIDGIPGVIGIPRSVFLINWMLTVLILGGIRILARWFFKDENLFINEKKSNVIIYGAGSAGRELSQALKLSRDYRHIAFIDDKLSNEKANINNIPVFTSNNIESLIKKFEVNEVFLALTSTSRKKRNVIIDKLSPLPVRVKSLPSFSEIAEGKVKVDDLLDIDIRDLLGREPVEANKKLLKTNITNKVVMVTGAGGSIGSELSRQISLLRPKLLILFEQSESSLYHIEQELLNSNNRNNKIISILGSIRDRIRLESIFKKFRVQTIYHAAAYKHVPLVEFNPSEGVLNNSIGSMVIAESAMKANVDTFVLISTDKAVRPTNTMGASKRVAELILQALSKKSKNTCFSIVRFGNVLDSSGSVIPTFKKQIKKGGPVTVTDKNIVRYFMTIPEAVELVIQAGAMGERGDVFVLDMGKPIRIYDLAVKMIQLSGLEVHNETNLDGDVEIKFTGLRPGEKLYEELLVGNNVVPTESKLIMRATEVMIEWKILHPILIELEKAASNLNQKDVRELLQKIVPEFKPQSKIKDLIND